MLSQRFRSRASVVEVQLGRLADCDASLSLIASDVTGLHAELAQLRAQAAELAQQLSERDRALALLDRERANAWQQAQTASVSLSEAEAGIEARDGKLASLEREHELPDLAAMVTGCPRCASSCGATSPGERRSPSRRRGWHCARSSTADLGSRRA